MKTLIILLLLACLLTGCDSGPNRSGYRPCEVTITYLTGQKETYKTAVWTRIGYANRYDLKGGCTRMFYHARCGVRSIDQIKEE